MSSMCLRVGCLPQINLLFDYFPEFNLLIICYNILNLDFPEKVKTALQLVCCVLDPDKLSQNTVYFSNHNAHSNLF